MKRLFLVIMACLAPCLALAAGEVYVYNWTEYMPDEVIQKFEVETGIKVVYSTYESNESMYARIKILPNYRHLDEALLDKPFDPGNAHSIPYVWGSTGIGYDSSKVKAEEVSSWKDLWNPRFRNKLVLNDDIREVFGIALKINGFSMNDTDPAHIEKAYESLKALLPNVRLFSADSPKQPFLNQEVEAGMIWNGEIYMAAQENPAIRYLYPREGAILWIDSMVIPKKAKNRENAHAFINYILKPEVAKAISEYVGYALANKTALGLFDEEMRGNRTVFPDRADIDRGEYQIDLGDTILIYEKYWEKLKTGN
jgi:spermidine/putrescine transport system substrate-binding protein